MATGFECYDSNGRLTFSLTDRLGRVLGTVPVVGATNGGSLYVADFGSGIPFALFFSYGDGNRVIPVITSVSGQTIFWSYGGNYANQGSNPSGYIIYGVY